MRIDFIGADGSKLTLESELIQQRKDGTCVAYGELFFYMDGEQISLGRTECDLVVDFVQARQPKVVRDAKA
jgi:hypothetical protein